MTELGIRRVHTYHNSLARSVIQLYSTSYLREEDFTRPSWQTETGLFKWFRGELPLKCTNQQLDAVFSGCVRGKCIGVVDTLLLKMTCFSVLYLPGGWKSSFKSMWQSDEYTIPWQCSLWVLEVQISRVSEATWWLYWSKGIINDCWNVVHVFVYHTKLCLCDCFSVLCKINCTSHVSNTYANATYFLKEDEHPLKIDVSLCSWLRFSSFLSLSGIDIP